MHLRIQPVFISVITLFFTIRAQAQATPWPGFETVADSFFYRYNFPLEDRYVRFEKRKDGWHVGEVLFSESDKAVQHRLFWSAATRQFVPLPYATEFEDSSVITERLNWFRNNFMAGNELYQFERNRYFGYNGWDWDIISESKEPVQLSDTALESAARAYGSYASGFFFNQFGYHFENNDSDRTLLKDDMPITKSRIEKYEWYIEKAIECYSILFARNPRYETYVGDIGIRLNNEIFSAYFNLTIAGAPERARKFLDRCRFSDSLLSRARNYLDDTPENAILITGGDNDTYPIWYLQEKTGYRKDVMAININLLGMKRYLQYLDDMYRHTLFSTSSTTFHKDYFAVFLKDETDADERNVAGDIFFKEIVWPDEKTDAGMQDKKAYPLYRADAIYFPCFEKGNMDVMSPTQRVSTGNFLYLNDYLLLDIIQTNCHKRKIAFTYFHQLLEDYLVPDNSIYLMDANNP